MKRKLQAPKREVVIITGLSGSGKGSVLKALEDLGFYSVDNLPVELIPKFAELARDNSGIAAAALVVDIREGKGLERFPQVYASIAASVKTRLIFLEADDDTIVRRFSETRRPHPLGHGSPITASIRRERRQLAPIRAMADLVINTSEFNVHALREFISERFASSGDRKLGIYVASFGFRNGIPSEADLVFDVRFLPNPNYIPRLKRLNGKNQKVARYIRSFPQTVEFIRKVSELLLFLIPHYIREGKSYLTIAFGCTGGQHRSVMIAEEIQKILAASGLSVKVGHRDIPA